MSTPMPEQRAAPDIRSVRAVWLGRVSYPDALERQREAERRLAAGGEETLFLLEHEPVFTLGRNASADDILFTPERCRELGIRSTKPTAAAASPITAPASSSVIPS